MRIALKKNVSNRDELISTHIFLEMGGGNLLAFFDFPEKIRHLRCRGLGRMHHVALKAAPAQYRVLLDPLDDKKIVYSIHGDRLASAVYLRGPDNILVEVNTVF